MDSIYEGVDIMMTMKLGKIFIMPKINIYLPRLAKILFVSINLWCGALVLIYSKFDIFIYFLNRNIPKKYQLQGCIK